MREPQRTSITLWSFSTSSHAFCKMDGKSGFVLTRYGNSSMTSTFFSSGWSSATTWNKSSQSVNVTLLSMGFLVVRESTPANRFMLWASLSVVARK